jgi:flagellar biosynthesis/type III secretory pathway protein FliH
VEGYLLGEDIYPSSNQRQEIAMEKTIKYLLQEAYVDGYKDGYNAASEESKKTEE